MLTTGTETKRARCSALATLEPRSHPRPNSVRSLVFRHQRQRTMLKEQEQNARNTYHQRLGIKAMYNQKFYLSF